MDLYNFIDIFDDLKTEKLEDILDQIGEYIVELADDDPSHAELKDNYLELLEESKESGIFRFDDFIPYLTDMSYLESDDVFGTEGMRLH